MLQVIKSPVTVWALALRPQRVAGWSRAERGGETKERMVLVPRLPPPRCH